MFALPVIWLEAPATVGFPGSGEAWAVTCSVVFLDAPGGAFVVDRRDEAEHVEPMGGPYLREKDVRWLHEILPAESAWFLGLSAFLRIRSPEFQENDPRFLDDAGGAIGIVQRELDFQKAAQRVQELIKKLSVIPASGSPAIDFNFLSDDDESLLAWMKDYYHLAVDVLPRIACVTYSDINDWESDTADFRRMPGEKRGRFTSWCWNRMLGRSS